MQEWKDFEDCNYTTAANSFYIPTEQALNINLDPGSGIQPSLGSLCKVRILILIQNQLVVNASFKGIQLYEGKCQAAKACVFFEIQKV